MFQAGDILVVREPAKGNNALIFFLAFSETVATPVCNESIEIAVAPPENPPVIAENLVSFSEEYDDLWESFDGEFFACVK